MQKDIVILIAEDDEGHAELVKMSLAHAGIVNEMLHFKDGQETLDFLFQNGDGPHRQPGASYVLLLDIRMPKLDGIEVLAQVRAHPELCKMPVIMLTTSTNPKEVECCYAAGCSNYIAKPVDYKNFMNTIQQLALFMGVMEVPRIN